MTAKELYKVDFTKGLDLGTEPDASPCVTYLENYRVDKKGGLTRRWGYEPVTNYLGTQTGISESSSNLTVEQTLFMTSFKDSLVRVGRSQLYSDAYHLRDNVPDMLGSYKQIASSTNSIVEPSSLSVTRSDGKVVRVVIYKTEVPILDTYPGYERYTDQYRDWPARQNTSNRWDIQNNGGLLFYSVYVDDVLLIDRQNIFSHDFASFTSSVVISAKLVSTKGKIIVAFAYDPFEVSWGSGVKGLSKKERTKCSAYFAFCSLDLLTPNSGFSPVHGCNFDVDVRVQNITERISTLVIDQTRNYVISGTNITIPYKVASGLTADPANIIRVGDKIQFRITQDFGDQVALGYVTVTAVDLVNKTFTVANGTTNAELITLTTRFADAWELHRIVRQHYYPLFDVAPCENTSSTANPGFDSFLVSCVEKDNSVPIGDNGYWLNVYSVKLESSTGVLAFVSYVWTQYSGAAKATDPSWSPPEPSTFVSALTLSTHIQSNRFWLTWSSVQRTMTAPSSYGYTDRCFLSSIVFSTTGVESGVYASRTPSVISLIAIPDGTFVKSLSSAAYLDNTVQRCAVVFTSYRVSSNGTVNGSFLKNDDGKLVPANGNDMVVFTTSIQTAGSSYLTQKLETIDIHKDMNARLASAPWLHNSSIYVALYIGRSAVYASSDAASLVVYDTMRGPGRSSVDTPTPRPVCNLLPRQVFYQNLTGNVYPAYHTFVSNVEAVGSNYRFVSTVSSQASATGISHAIDVTLSPITQRNGCSLNGSLFLSGGVPSAFDGSSVYELGSLQKPVIWTDFPDPVGNVDIYDPAPVPVTEAETGTWYYKAVWEWVDQAGNIYRSAPSDAIRLRMWEFGSDNDYTAINSKSVNPFVTQRTGLSTEASQPIDVKLHAEFDHSTIRASRTSTGPSFKDSKNPVKVVFYRTLKNDTTNYYRVSTMPVLLNLSNTAGYQAFAMTPSGAPTSGFHTTLGFGLDETNEVGNDPPISLTFTDIYSDEQIAKNEILYDLGGAILGNQSPPSSSFVCSHKNRVWLAGTPDDTIWFSKKVEPFSEPGFNEVLTIPAFEGGPVVGLASLDDYLVVFKASSTWIIQGDGPDPSGNNSTLQTPIRISEGTGCISANSIIVVDDTVYFQSVDGIYKIRRGVNDLELISEPIKEITVTYQRRFNTKVISATWCSLDNSIRFAFYGTYYSGVTQYKSSYVAVLNLTYNTWSSYRYTVPTTFRPTVSCEHNGVWHAVSEANGLIRESRTLKYDGGSANKYSVYATVQVGRLRLNEVCGLSRVQRVVVTGKTASVASPTSLSVAISSASPWRSSSSTRFLTGESYNTEFVEFPVQYQKSDAVQIQVVDYQSTTNGQVDGDGETMVLTGIVLYGNPMRGKAPKGKTVSRKRTAV